MSYRAKVARAEGRPCYLCKNSTVRAARRRPIYLSKVDKKIESGVVGTGIPNQLKTLENIARYDLGVLNDALQPALGNAPLCDRGGLCAECLGTECLGTECLGTECLGTECLGTECLGTECLGTECLGTEWY
jgi:hypothetical protein